MSAHPVRLQLSRRKGFSLQELSRKTNGLEAVNVARPSKWGNPFKVGEPSGYLFEDGGDTTPMIAALTLEQCIEFYKELLHGFLKPEMHPWGHKWMETYRRRTGTPFAHPWQGIGTLRGKNLACYCDLAAPCHSIYLLEIANR